MINIDILKNFTKNKLLMSLDSKRKHSPIIDELCKHLEIESKKDFDKKYINQKIECPVCLAELHIKSNDNDSLNIEIK